MAAKAVIMSAKDAIGHIGTNDLVVDATGVENVSLFLNAYAMEKRLEGKEFALFHSYLFGHGIAAQSFGNLGDAKACYRCLRPDRSKPWHRDPRRDVSQSDEPIDTGCGDGSFLPYGPYAGMAAAAQSAQHIHEWAQGTPGTRLRTLVLDHERGRVLKPESPNRHPSCPSCK